MKAPSTRKRGSAARKRPSAKATAKMLATTTSVPDAQAVRDELISFWDAFSPLNAASIGAAVDGGAALEDIGIGEDDGVTFINKYNSLIIRTPGKGPLVTTGEARSWLSKPMKTVIAEVAKRSQP